MTAKTLTTPGQLVYDMHGTNLLGAPYHADFNRMFEIRNVIEFDLNSDAVAIPSPAQSFLNWLDALCRRANVMYMNKYLVTISDRDGWWACAYCYDGRRGGMCQLRQRVMR